MLLQNKLGKDKTFEYSNDIVLLYPGYSDIKTAISIIEEGFNKNGVSANKRKCGILRISQRI